MQQANHRSRGLTKTHRLVSSSRSQPASTSQPAQTVIRTPIQTAEPPRSGHSTFRPILSWAAYLIIIITVHSRHALQPREARAGSIVFRWHREPWSHRAVAVADRPLAACFWLKLRKRRQASVILTEATVSAVAEVPCLYARWTSMESRWVTMATRSDEPDTNFCGKEVLERHAVPCTPHLSMGPKCLASATLQASLGKKPAWPASEQSHREIARGDRPHSAPPIHHRSFLTCPIKTHHAGKCKFLPHPWLGVSTTVSKIISLQHDHSIRHRVSVGCCGGPSLPTIWLMMQHILYYVALPPGVCEHQSNNTEYLIMSDRPPCKMYQHKAYKSGRAIDCETGNTFHDGQRPSGWRTPPTNNTLLLLPAVPGNWCPAGWGLAAPPSQTSVSYVYITNDPTTAKHTLRGPHTRTCVPSANRRYAIGRSGRPELSYPRSFILAM